MAAEMDIKSDSNDLPDLDGDSISEEPALESNEAFAMDLQGVGDDQDEVSIIESLQESAEGLDTNDADAYITDDVEDESFLKKIAEPFNSSQEDTNDEDGTIYYQEEASNLEPQFFQEDADSNVHQVDDEGDSTVILNQPNTSGSQRLLQINQDGDAVPIKSNVTFINKSDLNLMQIPQEVKMIKRPMQATPAKNVASKIFIQSTSKGPLVHRNIPSGSGGGARQEMSLSQAKRMGLITPKIQHMLSNMGPTRFVLKNVSSGSLIKTPAKILPTPTVQKLTQLPISVVRTNISQNQLRTMLTNTSPAIRPITVTKSSGALTTAKIEGRTPQKVFVRPGNSPSGSIKIPLQLGGGKQPVQLVKVINSPGGVSFTTVKPKMVQSTGNRTIGGNIVFGKSPEGLAGKRIFLNMGDMEKSQQMQMKTSTPISFKGKTYTAIKATPMKETKMPEIVTLDDAEGGSKLDLLRNNDDDDDRDLGPVSPQEILEANGIRPKKPCNCTRSQCLKLYCECFANGEFCYNCNCNNCFNNIEHEEERQQSIKSCLDRNPAAFQPKIQMADSDDEERRHNKGCNCKRSHCLKNYCECFEAKLTCGKYCKCLSCRNTEEDLAAWEQGDRNDSADEEPAAKATPYLPSNVAQALCDCILVQAEESERKGEDIVTTELRIIEELGQRLVQLIGNRTKKDSR